MALLRGELGAGRAGLGSIVACGVCLLRGLNTRANPVSVVWVKGHAKMIYVQRGRTTLLDKYGNDGADELVVAGAE